MRAAGLEPLTPYPGSQAPWPCRCVTCGSEVQPTCSRVRAGAGCRVCGYQRMGKKRHVAQEAAQASMTATGLEPLEPYPGRTGLPWRCRCEVCGQEVTPTLNAVRAGRGCRYCAGNAPRDPDDAAALMMKSGLEPLEPYRSNNTPWRCRCIRCGAQVTPRLSTITSGHDGCVYCSGRIVDPEVAAALMRGLNSSLLCPTRARSSPGCVDVHAAAMRFLPVTTTHRRARVVDSAPGSSWTRTRRLTSCGSSAWNH